MLYEVITEYKLAPIIITTLIALTIVKIITTIFTTPILGYANNWDFIRQSGCTGIWQHYPDKPKTDSNPDFTVNNLIFDGQKLRHVCVKSIDNYFPKIARNNFV